MSKFIKKPAQVEAITFAELVSHGVQSGGHVVDGYLWSFNYMGYAVTSYDENIYRLSNAGTEMFFSPNDMLVAADGKLSAINKDLFNRFYELPSCPTPCKSSVAQFSGTAAQRYT